MRLLFVLLALLLSNTSQAAEDGWMFGVSASYLMSQNLSLSGGSSVSTTNTYKAGFGVGLDLWNMPKSSWGFISGLEYNLKSNVSASTILTSLSSGSATGSLQSTTVYLGSDYRWDAVYIPLALEMMTPTFDSGNSTTSSTTGGYGLLTGLGFLIDHYAIDFIYETAQVSLTARGTGSFGSMSESSKGTWTSTRLGFHYFF